MRPRTGPAAPATVAALEQFGISPYRGVNDVVHCFLTGVQMPLESAFVLNRREARGLLAALSDRVTSLQRQIEQFAPLDLVEGEQVSGHTRQAVAARRKHRLVCKAVADAMSPAYPEIHLFLEWQNYQDQVRVTTLGGLRSHSRSREDPPSEVLNQQVTSLKNAYLGDAEYRPFRFQW